MIVKMQYGDGWMVRDGIKEVNWTFKWPPGKVPDGIDREGEPVGENFPSCQAVRNIEVAMPGVVAEDERKIVEVIPFVGQTEIFSTCGAGFLLNEQGKTIDRF